MKNLSVIFFSWLSSVVILLVYGLILNYDEDVSFVIFFGSIALGFSSVIALIGLYMIDFFFGLFSISEKNVFWIKLAFTLLFYAPISIGILSDGSLFRYFPIISLLSTLYILYLYHRELFNASKFSLHKNFSIMENESFNTQQPEIEPVDNSQKYITKGIILLVMGLILWLGTLLVDNLASTREEVKEKSLASLSEKWGDQLQVSGPYIMVPYQKKDIAGYAYLMPKKLEIENNVESAFQGRGIYENITFRNQIQSKGYFDIKDLTDNYDISTLKLDKAILCYGFNDAKSVLGIQHFKWNSHSLSYKNGRLSKNISSDGVYASVDLNSGRQYTFDIELNIKGTESIEIFPLGENTTIQLHTNWKRAAFSGKYVPNQKPVVSDTGLTAEWNIQAFNRSFPQSWLDEEYKVWEDNVKIGLSNPINNYKKTVRAIDYAILVIGLVFITFYIIEINGKKRSIHPIQYLLIGLALCLFYGLLLSFSELISFDLSYLIASVMTISLISAYIRSVLGQTSLGVITAVALSSVYTFLYILMIQENYALLLGNLGLFLILAIIMFFTRKMNKQESFSL